MTDEFLEVLNEGHPRNLYTLLVDTKNIGITFSLNNNSNLQLVIHALFLNENQNIDRREELWNHMIEGVKKICELERRDFNQEMRVLANARNGEGKTPLMLSIIYRDNLSKRLLKFSDLETGFIRESMNLLTMCISWNMPSLFYLILDHSNIDSYCDLGETPLYFAVKNSSEDNNTRLYVELLIAKGANPDIQDASGNTPLHIAAQQENTEFIKILTTKASKTIENNSLQIPYGLVQNDPLCKTLLDPKRNYYKKCFWGYLVALVAILGSLYVNYRYLPYTFVVYVLVALQVLLIVAVKCSNKRTKASCSELDTLYIRHEVCAFCENIKPKEFSHCFICKKCIRYHKFHFRFLNVCVNTKNWYLVLLYLLVTIATLTLPVYHLYDKIFNWFPYALILASDGLFIFIFLLQTITLLKNMRSRSYQYSAIDSNWSSSLSANIHNGTNQNTIFV